MERQPAKVSDLAAIGFAVVGFTFWVFADTAIKLVGQSTLPPYEMVAFLGLFMAVFLAIYAGSKRQIGVLRPHRVGRQLLRACLDMGNNVCVVIALRHLTLTLFYILIFLAPILISLMSAIFLGEGLSLKKAAAIGAGFAGVVIAVHPHTVHPSGGAGDWDWIGFGACLFCVACFSVNMVWSRVLTQTETPESLAFFSGLVTAAAGLALMLFLHAEPLKLWLAAGLFAMGLFCALGTLCFYIAVKNTSAANVSQYHYTQLLTGTFVSYLVWHNKPSGYVLLGGSLILAAGLQIAVAASQIVPLTEGN